MIIWKALKFLTDELNYGALEADPRDPPFVEVGNVARLDMDSDSSSSGKQEKVLISLVNIEEEKTLRNEPFYVRKKDPVNDREDIEKRNPTLHLNLYILISSAYDYEETLKRIGKIITYVQGKNVFTAMNAHENVPSQFPVEVEKIILDLFSPNFEQVNHLWSILGGKYVPSILYKMRLIPIQSGRSEKVGRVEEIRTDSNINN